ncbi:MAG: hypothetical protein GBAus27B_000266 [Mycoplasmataceae bacterium]|nr:MAG: hypothetical protein GBAus27B_000266 [Mycoplasmataceae bacterium]
MTQYTPKSLEGWFKGIASIRISRKKNNDSHYVNDAGYWEGGRCNWGGAHNLKEDCEKLSKFFDGIAELRNTRQELVKFINQKEFEQNKKALLTKTDNAIKGLNMKTSNTTSIGGVCCIWSDFKSHFDTQITNFRNEVERLKADIERVPYNEAKELQKLLSEERKLVKEIEENERKARNEPDENKRKQFIFLANEAKNKWKKLLERKSQLKTARLGDNFNPDQHINDFFQKLEEKLNRPLPTGNRSYQPTNPNGGSSNSTTFNYDPEINFPEAEFIPANDNQEPQSFLEKHWKEILIIGIYLLGTYYIVKQPENHGKE